MKNLNLNEQEKQRGWHDFCCINHANQTEFQADTLSASGRSAVSVTLEECPANNALITRLSRANHALLPLSRCVNTLIRIGDYVVGGRARRGAGKEVVAMMRQKCMMWKYAAMVVLMLTLGVGEMWGYKRVVFQYQGWFVTEQAYVEYADSEGAGTWSWRAANSLGDNWWYYDFPDWCTNMNFRRKDDGTNSQNYNNFTSAIYYIYINDKNQVAVSKEDFKSGFQGGNDDRWLKVGANGAETLIKPNSSTFDQNIGTTVNLYLKEFGAWTWKKGGNVGKMTLVYKLGKDGPGDQTDWHTTYTESLGDGENSTDDGYTYQPWKWTGNLDLLTNLKGEDKNTLNSGTYYLKYYYSAYVNRASTGDCFEELPYDRNGDYYFIHFTIPQPQVTISGRPYAGIESILTAAPKSGTTIDGQTFQYQFERSTDGGTSWTTAQAYSSTATYTYTPASTSDIIRVKMKVVETNEESAYVQQTVYEQYYIYVEDTREWGQMWMTMKNTDNNTYYLGREFPGEKLLPCDTIDGNPIYRVTLDSYFHRLWLSVGNNTKQTYNAGFPINFDIDNGGGNYTYGIKKVNAGNYYMIATDNNENNCYLTAYPTTLYRVVSYDGETGKTYYSNSISSTEGTGTVSFFANTAHASSTVYIQTWSNTGATESGLNGAWTTNTSTNYKSSLASVSATGTVFTATLSSSSLSDFAVYDGGYDIHVYANTENYLEGGIAKGGVGTKFTKFENNPIFGTELYNYYWVDWFAAADISVVATVGNAYNTDLAGVISTDPYAPEGQTTGSGANVRYAYNPATNYFKRTMIAGSGNLIKIQGTYVTPSGSTEGAEASFGDASAWVYTLEASVKGQATATVTTSYNGHAQTLEANKQLIGGGTSNSYDVLITYDFKTNRLLAAWQPPTEGESFDGFDLSSNLMAIRTENAAPTVLNLTTSHNLSNIQKIYTALELTYNNWAKDGGNADRRIVSSGYIDEYYWISLPYDCNIGDIFGIEGYGDSWVIQTYHGDYRARNGWWAETESWWYDLDRTDMMEKNKGYVLRVTNLNGENGSSDRFPGGEGTSIFLYFPSKDSKLAIGQLSNSATDTTTTVPEHKCEVWRGREKGEHEGNPNYDRRVIDSNWNIIGSPSFNTAKIVEGDWSIGRYPASGSDSLKANAPVFKYFYTWNAGTYTPRSATGYEFKATHAYLVQYAGPITWQKWNDGNPLVVLKAPARNQEEQGDRTLKMVLNKDGEQADVTYISRMAEGATEGYDLNLDLSKLLSNSGNNLYTLAGYYKMAGNCLPETTTTVPVGVQIAAEGEYTFSMPEGTNGTGAVLIDNIAGTRTNLALTDYTVQLPAGQTDNRFVLELSPISNVATGIENVQGDNVQGTNAQKRIVDGVLYIVKDGQVFDARGNKVK